MTIRTRFAPSPTGYLHVGGARTALYSWLYARKHKGKFILRIEDTDSERSSQESVDAILDSMQWLGLDWDEGPFYQTQRFERYQEVIQQLLNSGHAYRCYCSKQRLDELREKLLAEKKKPRYDGCCRNKDLQETNNNNSYVIRFRNPDIGAVIFDDLVRGTVSIENTELDDLIILRSNNTPTYNFTVVVDDMDMQISDVIRGEDHIGNTPRQINLLKALGANIPRYAHIPMILGEDHKRLSKRHGAVSVMQYKQDGYLPEALLNYLVRLGWSYGDKEIFSIDEMIDLFSIKSINKSAAAFNTEKLNWLNQHYIMDKSPEELVSDVEIYFQQLNLDITQGPKLIDLISALHERCKTLQEMAEKSKYFYQDIIEVDSKAAKKHLKPELLEPLQAVYKSFQITSVWQAEQLHKVITENAENFSLKLGKLAQPIRVAVTGNTVSPPLDVTLSLIGKKRCLQRLQVAIEMI